MTTHWQTMGILIGITVLTLIPGNAWAAGGKAFFSSKPCKICHGADGNHPVTPFYPKISAHSKQYILNQVNDIQSGKRANGLTVTMRPYAKLLQEEEIRLIAEYLATVER